MSTRSASVAVLRVMWQQWRNRRAAWPLFVVAAVFAFAAFGLATLLPAPLRAVVPAVFAAITAVCGWAWFVFGLLAQNRPHAARLVPGHLRLLRSMWSWGWAMLVALAALIGAGFGMSLAAALVTAAIALAISWMIRWPWLGIFTWLIPTLGRRIDSLPFARPLIDAAGQAWHESAVASFSMACVLLIACSWLSALTLLRSGGVRHRRDDLRRTQRRALLLKPGDVAGHYYEGNRPRGPSAWLYRWAMRRASVNPRGPVLPRALVGLLPTLHWTRQLIAAISLWLLIGALMLLVNWLSPNFQRYTLPMSFWSSFALLSWMIGTAGRTAVSLYRSRREQALLMLVPGMPRGIALNRPLVHRLLMQFGLSWAIGVVGALLLFSSSDAHFGWFVTMAASTLLLGAWACSDWSRMPAPSAATAFQPFVWPVGATLLTVCLQVTLGVSLMVCVAALIAVAAGWTAWRYRRVMHAPTAFPAARRL